MPTDEDLKNLQHSKDFFVNEEDRGHHWHTSKEPLDRSCSVKDTNKPKVTNHFIEWAQ